MSRRMIGWPVAMALSMALAVPAVNAERPSADARVLMQQAIELFEQNGWAHVSNTDENAWIADRQGAWAARIQAELNRTGLAPTPRVVVTEQLSPARLGEEGPVASIPAPPAVVTSDAQLQYLAAQVELYRALSDLAREPQAAADQASRAIELLAGLPQVNEIAVLRQMQDNDDETRASRLRTVTAPVVRGVNR